MHRNKSCACFAHTPVSTKSHDHICYQNPTYTSTLSWPPKRKPPIQFTCTGPKHMTTTYNFSWNRKHTHNQTLHTKSGTPTKIVNNLVYLQAYKTPTKIIPNKTKTTQWWCECKQIWQINGQQIRCELKKTKSAPAFTGSGGCQDEQQWELSSAPLDLKN